MELHPFTCTIRVFHTNSGDTLAQYALPVDSPDAGHAAASTLANAASFTPKTDGGMGTRPVAFACVKVERRG